MTTVLERLANPDYKIHEEFHLAPREYESYRIEEIHSIRR